MGVCMPDGSQCYNVKTVPVITSLSENSGYKSGGQSLTITGNGFRPDLTSVLVDGVPCTIFYLKDSTLSCETGARSSASVNGLQLGARGILRKIYYGTSARQPTTSNYKSAIPAF